MAEKVRIDKWLWSVRLFKSRTLAADACKAHKVRLNQQLAKASATVTEGDLIEIKRQGFNFLFRIDQLIKTRVSAVLAAPCYTNLTPEEELNKYKNWFVGKAVPETRDRGTGRPTKRERREIDGFKTTSFDFASFWEEE
ncbi:MAG: RNA-binding S4 domain-containing protein [Saprospiraceae bacterium]|nr:RNA-binding S4 domain-containing protein [Saprospiraceae bacterium]